MNTNGIRSIATNAKDTAGALTDLLSQLEGFDAAAIVFFSAATHDGGLVSRTLTQKFPAAAVIGCSTNGEFSQDATSKGGISALALAPSKIKRASARLVRFSDGDDNGGMDLALSKAAGELATGVGASDLRSLDPQKFVGIVLFDGLHGHEERGNELLGNLAPTLSFVGGSAGDDLTFTVTKVFSGDQETDEGAALLLFESAVPFVISKTCSFVPSETSFVVTRADVKNRVIYELDGEPVLEAYAKALGTTPDQLNTEVFMSHPLGVMIDGQAWIRSPAYPVPDGGLKFYCNVDEGMRISVMNSTDLVADTREAMQDAKSRLGAPISGGLAFNCVLRRLEMDAKNLHQGFLDTFKGMQVGGFHTNGETWLGHINQTFTALWFA
jgi:hypothetical protein